MYLREPAIAKNFCSLQCFNIGTLIYNLHLSVRYLLIYVLALVGDKFRSRFAIVYWIIPGWFILDILIFKAFFVGLTVLQSMTLIVEESNPILVNDNELLEKFINSLK